MCAFGFRVIFIIREEKQSKAKQKKGKQKLCVACHFSIDSEMKLFVFVTEKTMCHMTHFFLQIFQGHTFRV